MVGPKLFYLTLLAGATALTGGLAGYAWRHREEPGATSLAAAMVGVTAWTVLEILAITRPTTGRTLLPPVPDGEIPAVASNAGTPLSQTGLGRRDSRRRVRRC